MDELDTAELDAQYRVLREESGYLPRRADGFIAVLGSEAGEYLQGQVTNDVEVLEPGQGAYAALLERKARIKADMDVLRLGGAEYLIHTEPAALPTSLKHLEMYKIGRDVEVRDLSPELVAIAVIGPQSRSVLGSVPRELLSHRIAEIGGSECRVVARPIGQLPAYDVIVPAADSGEVMAALSRAGCEEVSGAAVEIARVEAGIPRFGHEITEERMPAEAGIVARAINFEKGCYIGQEPVARLHYRGRPNRELRSVKLSSAVPEGSTLELDGKEVGTLTTSVLSPAQGPIGLAILRREAEPGASLAVTGTEAVAKVVQAPGSGESPA